MVPQAAVAAGDYAQVEKLARQARQALVQMGRNS